MTKYIFDGEKIDVEHYIKTGRKHKMSKKEVFCWVLFHLTLWTVILLSYWIPLRVLNPIVVP